ncbi:MAG: hypothetical protein IPL77_21945 [Flavobacteriales bacterium]|nr:hypothetical protein [Flavobacteriales bacterium]
MNTRTQRNAARGAIVIAALALCSALQAQVLISNDGGTNTVGSNIISWSIGEPIIGTGAVPGGIVTQGFHQAEPVRLKLNIRAFLQGPYNSVSGAMNDGLRANGLLPLTEPYTALGYPFVGGGGESTTQPIIDFPGSNAIIDWVLLELRDKNDNSSVSYSRSALLQADGDIVDMDGFSAVRFPMPADDYYLAIRHRNHLAVMTLNSLTFSSAPAIVDLTDGSTATYGTNAQQVVAVTHVLWAGDVNFDGTLKYTGQDNDRDPILSAIGGVVPTNTITSYHSGDVNMDGTVKYTGQDNDRDPILQNIGGVVPTNVRVEQVP